MTAVHRIWHKDLKIHAHNNLTYYFLYTSCVVSNKDYCGFCKVSFLKDSKATSYVLPGDHHLNLCMYALELAKSKD